MRRRLVLLLATAVAAVAIAAPVAARQPGPTIVETAIAVNRATGDFDELIAAVSRAGLVDALNGNRQLTVFAPTDAAFEDLYDALGVAGIEAIPLDTLTAVLLHHVAPGERLSGDVLASTRMRTLNRDFLRPTLDSGTSWIDDARIVAADVDASNGVIHVIDSVLIPGD